MSEPEGKEKAPLKVLLIEVGKADLRAQVGFNEFHYNLALGYLARAARAKAPIGAGIPKDNVRIFFQFRETDEEIILRAVQFDPDVIGFTCYTNNWPKTQTVAREIQRRLERVDGNRKRWFLIGGVHATTSYQEIFNDSSFDIAVLGEGEKTFVQLLNLIAKNPSRPKPVKDPTEWNAVKGIAFPTDGKVHNTAPNDRLEDLDEYYDEEDAKTRRIKYGPVRPPESFNLPKNVYPAVPGNPPFASISFSRGCKGSCTFCSNPSMYPGGPKFRTAEHIFSEMMRFRNTADPRGKNVARDWYVDDEDVFSAPEILYKLCHLLIAANKPASADRRITWMGLASIKNSLAAMRQYAEWFNVLRESGCVMLGFGLESGDQGARKSFRKFFTKDEAIQVVDAAFGAGIIPVGFFLLGTPEETISSLKATFEFASELKCLRYRFSYLYPYPGTELRNKISATERWIEPIFDRPEYAALNIPVVKCEATNPKTNPHLTANEFAATGSAFLKALYESQTYANNVNAFLMQKPEWEYSFRVNWRGIVANDIIAGHNPNAYKRLQNLKIIPGSQAEGQPAK